MKEKLFVDMWEEIGEGLYFSGFSMAMEEIRKSDIAAIKAYAEMNGEQVNKDMQKTFSAMAESIGGERVSELLKEKDPVEALAWLGENNLTVKKRIEWYRKEVLDHHTDDFFKSIFSVKGKERWRGKIVEV